ncbi:hypothetical protein NE237_003888 [Protea cynaroides]|uniref:NADH-ubiquinone oxidoreductase 9.6 kDa subunit n=1 Tax=Protea cynaroides TaxID=273540 RepID=A0A9Q0KHX4_9MAGN|nr:hypothetical protein NE237_003888 [Protea cynaroides]
MPVPCQSKLGLELNVKDTTVTLLILNWQRQSCRVGRAVRRCCDMMMTMKTQKTMREAPRVGMQILDGDEAPSLERKKHPGVGGDRWSILGSIAGARTFSQSAAFPSASCLDKEEVTTRVVEVLKSIPFVDPAKVSPVAKFKDDLHLDTLDNVEVMMAVEEEFAVDISDSEASKFSTTAHLIDYIATHPQAK